MTITIDGKSLSIEMAVDIARHNHKIELSNEAIERINVCRELVEKKLRENAIMYGVNTGIGELSEVVLSPEQVEQFQKYLIYSHTAGCGDPVPEDAVRAAILSRINVLCNGRSGVRLEIVETLRDMLKKGLRPLCSRKDPWEPPETFLLWGRWLWF